jgi:phage I-like protein
VAREISDKERETIPAEDFAGKGTSYPIVTPEDVHDAAASIGRAGEGNYDAGTLKANIVRIAKRKGAAYVARLPEAWQDGAKVERCDAVVASYVIELSDGRKRVPIAQLGVRYKGKQRIEITRPMLADVVRNFRKLETGEVPIDYDHSIEFAAGNGDAIPAAGWIKAIDDGPDRAGILWGSVEWTERARKMIAGREYKYVSPVIDPAGRDNKTGEPQGWTLTSAALTNTPVLKGMPALVLSEAGWESRGDAEKEKKRVVKIVLTDRAAGKVKVVADDGSETTALVEGLEAPPKVLRLADVKRDAKSQELDFASLDCNGETLVAGEVFRAQQAQMALSEAMKAGKILPPQRAAFERMALSDLPAFRELVAAMKPQIELTTQGTADAEGAPEGDAVGAQLAAAVRAKISASEGGGLDYGEAMRLALSENPGLARAYKATMGGRG